MKKISILHYGYVLAALIFTITAWNSKLLQTTCSDHSVVAEKVVQAAEGVSQEKRKSLDKGSKSIFTFSGKESASVDKQTTCSNHSIFTFTGEEEEIAAMLAELLEIAEGAAQATIQELSKNRTKIVLIAIKVGVLVSEIQLLLEGLAQEIGQEAAEGVVQVVVIAAAITAAALQN